MKSEDAKKIDNMYSRSFLGEAPVRYKKKKNQSSKSSKRSDHKHQYEKILIDGLFWHWGERCTVCGRINTKTKSLCCPDFVTEDTQEEKWGYRKSLTLDEIKKKFVGIPIYKFDYEKFTVSGDYYVRACTSLKYKSFYGVYTFSEDDNCYCGKIDFITDLVLFEGDTVESIEAAFREAVDDYISVCRDIKTQERSKNY